MIRQGINHCADVAIEKIIEIISGHIDAVIGDAALREIIGANTFAAIASAYLAFTCLRLFGVLFLYHGVEQARPQDFHCLDFVFELGFFVLTGNNKACRQVSDAYSRIGCVDALAAVTGGAIYVNP